MATFIGWASYSTDERYCPYCKVFYDVQDSHEHDDCKSDEEEIESEDDE